MKTSNNNFFGTIFIILIYTTLYGKEMDFCFFLDVSGLAEEKFCFFFMLAVFCPGLLPGHTCLAVACVAPAFPPNLGWGSVKPA